MGTKVKIVSKAILKKGVAFARNAMKLNKGTQYDLFNMSVTSFCRGYESGLKDKSNIAVIGESIINDTCGWLESHFPYNGNAISSQYKEYISKKYGGN